MSILLGILGIVVGAILMYFYKIKVEILISKIKKLFKIKK